jgi:4-methylaminobutanoate oxidase (formaldehyde-forming)
MFGHTLGKPLGMGYIANGAGLADAAWVAAGRYEIEVAGERIPASASIAPPYDPGSLRVKDVPERAAAAVPA